MGRRGASRQLTLKPDVHFPDTGEGAHLHEWVLQALPARVQDADLGNDSPTVELCEERGAHLTVPNCASGDDDRVEVGGQPGAAVDQGHDRAALEREHLADRLMAHQQLGDLREDVRALVVRRADTELSRCTSEQLAL